MKAMVGLVLNHHRHRQQLQEAMVEIAEEVGAAMMSTAVKGVEMDFLNASLLDEVDQSSSKNDSEHLEVLDAIHASSFKHGNSRTLQDHLLGTRAVLEAWCVSAAVRTAGMFHSVYSTEAYKQAAVSYDRRPFLAVLIGAEAEQLVYLFSVCRFKTLFRIAQSVVPPAKPLVVSFRNRLGDDLEVPPDTVWDLLTIHAANLVEQSSTQNGFPDVWLSRLSDWVFLGKAAGREICPPLKDLSAAIELHDEMAVLDLYRSVFSLGVHEHGNIVDLLCECVEKIPSLAEPHLWLAWAYANSGKSDLARQSAHNAAKLFARWGATWDKRIGIEEAQRLAQDLQKKQRSANAMSRMDDLAQAWAVRRVSLPQSDRAAQYFERALNEKSPTSVGWYPGLTSKCWHDPQQFSFARRLEEAFLQIQSEALRIENGFHEEAENIQREGSWQVFMLYETGRKHEDNCANCPTLARLIEEDTRVRKSGGLIYLSRLKPQTKVVAHRGPTNMRLRLHLPIRVPAGDCGMRVGSEMKGWKEGQCVVFDDFYEHEVWNNTEEERIVLVADLWHADLTDEEVNLLSAMDWISNLQAVARSRYWENNQKAREQSTTSFGC